MNNQKIVVKIGNLYYSGFPYKKLEEVRLFNMTLNSGDATLFADEELAKNFANHIGGKTVKVSIVEDESKQ